MKTRIGHGGHGDQQLAFEIIGGRDRGHFSPVPYHLSSFNPEAKPMFRYLVLFLVMSTAAFAAAPLYEIDPGHTRVLYRISHLGFSEMPGRFNDIKGTVHFDPADVSTAAVDITINAASVSMDHDVLDKKLLGKEFFNVEQYPTITFKSTAVEKTGEKRGTVTGDLTFLGVTKPVTLNVRFNKKGWNEYMGSEQVGFTAWGKIKRSDFGFTAYAEHLGDTVPLRIEVEAYAPKAKEGDKPKGE